MQFLQEISQSMKSVVGSSASEKFTRVGAELSQLKAKVREELQAATAGEVTRILKKLEDGQPLSSEEKEVVGLWVVGDAQGYTKMENDYQTWLAEFKRLSGALAAYEGQEASLRTLVEAHGLLEDAVRVAADISHFLEMKERVTRFTNSINSLTKDDARFLAEMLKSMLTRSDM